MKEAWWCFRLGKWACKRACLTMVNVSTPSVHLSVCIPSRWWKLNKAPQSGYAKRVHTLASRTFSVIETCRDLRLRHATSFRFVFLSTIKMWHFFFFFFIGKNMFPKNLQYRVFCRMRRSTICKWDWCLAIIIIILNISVLNLRFNHPHSIYEIGKNDMIMSN